MQIPEEILKCVVFLACRKNSGYEIGGTGFLVGYPLKNIEESVQVYVVTARHVVEEITSRSDGNVYCRMNTHERRVQFVPIPISQWVYHDDCRVDVAVVPIPFDLRVCDHKFLPLESFITPEIIAKEQMGIGDDLFFPGLFTHRPGEKANLPIVRIGNIAAMPAEPIETKWGSLCPGYLVEARSIGGLSGSPVFWYQGTTRIRSGALQFGGPSFFLIGLIHGHYRNPETKAAWDAPELIASDSLASNSINMGIAIVVSATGILDTLNGPLLQRDREKLCQGILASKQLSLLVADIVAATFDLPSGVSQLDTGARTEDAPSLSTSFTADTLSNEQDDSPMNS